MGYTVYTEYRWWMSREIMEITFRLFNFDLFIYVLYVLLLSSLLLLTCIRCLFSVLSFRLNDNDAYPNTLIKFEHFGKRRHN